MESQELKKAILGEWVSIAPEIRPSIAKNADGSLKPFYLTRLFNYLSHDRFRLEITNYADAFGKTPLCKISLAGHIEWQGDHPIAAGAQKVKFLADEAYELTALLEGFADFLNQSVIKESNEWIVNEKQSLFKKEFAAFGLKRDQLFVEFDLIYFSQGMLFWGARNIDGRGFETEANRPNNLQIPMIRRSGF